MFGRQSQREQPTANGVAEGLTKLDLVRGCVAVLLRGGGTGFQVALLHRACVCACAPCPVCTCMQLATRTHAASALPAAVAVSVCLWGCPGPDHLI